MDQNEYLKSRVDNQIDWYDKKSRSNQMGYKVARIVEIACAVSIPFVMGCVSDSTLALKMIGGTLGVIVAFISGFLGLYQFQSNWIEYRTTCESLRHQKYLFLTKTRPYNGKDAYPVFVATVESLISKENTNWAQVIKAREQKEKK
jgi:hypothetical protein